jgi:ABC-type transporter Mla subunit MlaD
MAVTEKQASIIKYHIIPQAYLEKFQKFDQYDASINHIQQVIKNLEEFAKRTGDVDTKFALKADVQTALDDITDISTKFNLVASIESVQTVSETVDANMQNISTQIADLNRIIEGLQNKLNEVEGKANDAKTAAETNARAIEDISSNLNNNILDVSTESDPDSDPDPTDSSEILI